VAKRWLVLDGYELARNNCPVNYCGLAVENVLHLVIRLSNLCVINIETATREKFLFQEKEEAPSTLPNRCLMNCLILMQSCFSLPFRCSSDAVLYRQHRPWPPPSELRLVSCEARLRPLPWSSFNMVERYSVLCHLGRLWKPPWFPSLRQLIRVVFQFVRAANMATFILVEFWVPK